MLILFNLVRMSTTKEGGEMEEELQQVFMGMGGRDEL